MADLWLPGATRVPGNNGLRAGAGGGRDKDIFTWHSFEAPYTFSPDCIAAARYLNVQGSTATFCLHPITGAIAQLLPANQAARTLRVRDGNGNFADVNRYGRVHMQVEVIAYARRPFTLDLTRAGLDGLTTLMNFLRSHGVKDQWAWRDQAPPVYPGGSVRRRWPDQSGHAYHSGWPVNDHGDPGAIEAPWVIVGTTTRPSLPQPPRAEDDLALYGFTVAHWRWVQTCLADLGYLVDPDGDPVDGDPQALTLDALRRYQRDAGLTRDGLPGPDTTAHLEDTMTNLPDRTASAVWGTILTRPGMSDARADTILRYAAHRSQVDALAEQAAETAGQVAAIREVVDQLAAGAGGSVDLTAVTAAAKAGADQALAGYRLTLDRAETEQEQS